MNKPLVTVFIPVYNCEKYIEESLESIINQTYENLDILIIDDGSTDNTVNLIQQYKDKRIRLLRNDRNRGIPYTRSRGLEECKGKYLALMDADDISLPERIKKQVNFLEENKDIDAIGAYYQKFGGKINRIVNKPSNSEEIRCGLIFANQIGNPTSMIRVSSIKKHNILYNKNYFVVQDYDFWVQLSKVGKIDVLKEVLLKYRTGHSNISKKSRQEKHKERRYIMDQIHNDILDFYGFKLNDEEKSIFNNFFDDNPQLILQDYELKKLDIILKKIINHNKQVGLFNEKIFIDVIKRYTLGRIIDQPGSIKDKIKIYNALMTNDLKGNTLYELSSLCLKHLYKKI